jgi:hypothetical protein
MVRTHARAVSNENHTCKATLPLGEIHFGEERSATRASIVRSIARQAIHLQFDISANGLEIGNTKCLVC